MVSSLAHDALDAVFSLIESAQEVIQVDSTVKFELRVGSAALTHALLVDWVNLLGSLGQLLEDGSHVLAALAHGLRGELLRLGRDRLV